MKTYAIYLGLLLILFSKETLPIVNIALA